MFSRKHVHRWTEIARTYAPPVKCDVKMHSESLGERFAFGVTTLVFRCADETCGELHKIEALGKEAPKP